MGRNKDGTFEKGTSGNPGGRPKAPVRLREMYDTNDDDLRIYHRLWDWIKSDNAKASLGAIAILLSRRYGNVATLDDNGTPVERNSDADLRRLEELRARYPELQSKSEPNGQDA